MPSSPLGGKPFHEFAVPENRNFLGIRRYRRFMRDHHDRSPMNDREIAQQLANRPAIGTVEAAGRLIGQDDRRIGRQRPANRPPLLLPSRERSRPMPATLRQTQAVH